MSNKSILDALDKGIEKIRSMSKEEFNKSLKEKGLYEKDYKYENYISNDFELILPGREEIIKLDYKFTIPNYIIDSNKNKSNNYFVAKLHNGISKHTAA
ncbi:MAG TPA: hypothetical protein DCP90_00425 [Clostridiales bacterium]|nr:MAG: hypothetical protein A2Y22_08140 [Clostridiales bacterium GWD2_32_59]HAN09061.1 hypothetical protein [Clostridiales bacterium]